MKRQFTKVLIILLAVLMFTSGFKAIQINSDQKSQLAEYEEMIRIQNDKIQYLSQYEKEIKDRDLLIEEKIQLIEELNCDVDRLNAQYEAVKAQNQKLTDKVVYLTFDDGPSKKATTEILNILDQYGIKATFFVQGRNVSKYPDILKKIVKSGHAIGNHSYSHSYNGIYASSEAFWNDFDSCQEVVFNTIGIYPELFRFPGGSNTAVNLNGQKFVDDINAQLIERHIQYIDWNVDSGDAKSNGASSESIQNTVANQLQKKKKVVVLFHDTDAKMTTVKALPGVIEYYLAKGYRFDKLDASGFSIQF